MAVFPSRAQAPCGCGPSTPSVHISRAYGIEAPFWHPGTSSNAILAWYYPPVLIAHANPRMDSPLA